MADELDTIAELEKKYNKEIDKLEDIKDEWTDVYNDILNQSLPTNVGRYYTRKQSLLDYAKNAKKSVGDYATQLAFLYKELSESYVAVLNTLKGAKTVKEASDAVMTQFERPADMSDAVKTKRAGYGQEFYNKFVTSGSGSGGNEEPEKPGCYASTVIAVAQNELGYYEKASNSNLDDKTANKGKLAFL